MTSEATISKTVFLAAPRTTVWAFLTDKDLLAAWFHPATADLTLDQDFVLMHMPDDGEPVRQCWGRVLEMEPPVKLKYTFTIKPLKGVMTTVTWHLDEVLGGTKLTLVHEGIGEIRDAALGLLVALDAGWDRHLGNLRGASSSKAG